MHPTTLRTRIWVVAPRRRTRLGERSTKSTNTEEVSPPTPVFDEQELSPTFRIASS